MSALKLYPIRQIFKIGLTYEQHAKLRTYCHDNKKTMAEVIRQLIDDHLPMVEE